MKIVVIAEVVVKWKERGARASLNELRRRHAWDFKSASL